MNGPLALDRSDPRDRMAPVGQPGGGGRNAPDNTGSG
jgi:hypothetical protein